MSFFFFLPTTFHLDIQLTCIAQLAVPELPSLPEPPSARKSEFVVPPPAPVDKDSIRSASSTRRRPVPPPKDKQRSRPSMLHVSASQPELAQRRPTGRRRQYPIISQLASLKHWFVESAKRAKSPHAKASSGGQSGGHRKLFPDKLSPSKGQDTSKKTTAEPSSPAAPPPDELATPTQVKRASNASSLAPSSASYYNNRHSYPRQPRPLSTSHPSYRNSLSPSPITPKGSYRRSSAGLRGRKSTSSSISSIRSIHHTHTHSKASSVSSNSVGSASTPTARPSKSPHPSVKVLPTTPGASSRLPSNVRLVRGSQTNLNNSHVNGLHDVNEPQERMQSMFNEAAPAPFLSSPASSLVFARRKRSAFKGPMIHTANLMVSGGLSPAAEHPNSGGNGGGGGGLQPSQNVVSRPGTRKSQIIEEDEEAEEAEDEEVEEVDAFSGAEEEPTDSEQDAKPSLAPAPDLPSPSHPPRSSSLKRPSSKPNEPSGSATATAESTDSNGEDDQKDNASLTPVASPKTK